MTRRIEQPARFHRALSDNVAHTLLCVLLGTVLLGIVPLSTSCSQNHGEPEAPSDAQLAEHRQEVEAWRDERIESLRDPEGWLSLTGLDWLEVGDNVVGSGAEADVKLPASAPERAGVIHVEQAADRTMAYWRPDRALGDDFGDRDEDEPLVADTAGEPTELRAGSALFYLLDRDGKLGVRVKDLEHPAIASFAGIDSHPISWSWRVPARYVAYDPPKPFPVPTVLGTTLDEAAPGYIEFEARETYRIDALDAGGGEIWLIFGDATNGDTTYGGGRFLYAELDHGDPTQSGTVIVDFNKAYNPPCAFTPYATCPLPPPDNKLALAIEAGEKDYGTH